MAGLAPVAELVEVQYSQLLAGGPELLPLVEQAYGPGGLGILTVAGVPRLPELRAELLPLGHAFASLPEEVRGQYEDPGSSFNFGWSHGREALADGQPDRYKGSYYANPLTNQPLAGVPEDQAAALAARYPSYCRPNIWPAAHLPRLEHALMALGQCILQVGLLLTRQCDAYVASRNPRAPHGSLEQRLQRSTCPKARLLYYFPPPSNEGDGARAWCGWHTDHGSLTGLTSGMFLRGGEEVACPDPGAGLHIRDRNGGIVRAAIPAGHLAFQMGEAMQVHSGGLLRATPHCVRAPSGAAAAGVARSTFAVFMQPKWDEPMELPPGSLPAEDVGVGQWRQGLTFGEFAELTMRQYYKA